MNAKEELTILAKEKGFESRMVSASEWKHSSLEPLRWLCWMTELQKWLREEYKVYIQIPLQEDMESICESFDVAVVSLRHQRYMYEGTAFYYEEALETALMEALKLI